MSAVWNSKSDFKTKRVLWVDVDFDATCNALPDPHPSQILFDVRTAMSDLK